MPPRGQASLRPLVLALLAAVACGPSDPAHDADVPVQVARVAVDSGNIPVVILEEEGGERWLPIWIGPFEAHSIQSMMDGGYAPPRPNTHDLAKALIANLRGEVVRVVVTELRDSTYYAVLSLVREGELLQLDSRPSDAIAIALRTDAPIFVRTEVFEASSAVEGREAEGRPILFEPGSVPRRDGIPTATPVTSH